MKFRRLRITLGLVAFLATASAGAGLAQIGQNPNAPPPPPLPNINPNASSQSTSGPVTPPPPTLAPSAIPSALALPPSPAPSAAASAGPRRGRRAAPANGSSPAPSSTDTPEPPQFSTLDGIWEVEVQPIGSRLAKYEHFNIVQNGSTLSGYWEHDPNKTRTPITGTFDGRLISISADLNGTPATFTGYVESFGDMVGMRKVGSTDSGMAFTAQHRKKEASGLKS